MADERRDATLRLRHRKSKSSFLPPGQEGLTFSADYRTRPQKESVHDERQRRQCRGGRRQKLLPSRRLIFAHRFSRTTGKSRRRSLARKIFRLLPLEDGHPLSLFVSLSPLLFPSLDLVCLRHSLFLYLFLRFLLSFSLPVSLWHYAF